MAFYKSGIFRLGVGGVLAIGFLVSSCNTPTSSATFANQSAPPPKVQLSAGDVVRLSFPAAPELNQSQKIRADGRLSLPLIGEVDAARKTVGQLQSELIQLYKSQLKDSAVTVSLESSVTQVTVSGAVGKGGAFVFEKPTTVFQAIMQAGGASEFGNLSKVRLVRTINGIQRSQVMDVRQIVNGSPTRAFYVRDGDVIYVPPSMF